MIIYDYIIIGAGPSGLTFATLADKNNKILIIDKDDNIGGCHKVNRQKYENEYYFSEHGPRIYSNSYVNFKMILNIIGLKFNDIFTKVYFSEFGLLSIINKNKIFTSNEIFIIIMDLMNFLINSNYGKDTIIYDYLIKNKFNLKAINFIDRFCRIVDGGDMYRISINTLFNIINDMSLYKIYQPIYPNDELLFKIWTNYLLNKNIKIKLNTIINKIEKDNNSIIKINTNNDIFYTKNIIFAIPPENLNKIITNSPRELFNNSLINNLDIYSKETNYNEYISISFHWNYKIKSLNKENYGFYSNTDWGIIAIILSDYMKFKENNSKTMISCAITITNNKSKYINKTPNECNKEELIDEVFRQLKDIYNNLPIPTLSFINNKYIDKKWESNEKAFIKIPKYDYLDNKIGDNIYILGTHNGNSKIHFTSFESAVSNAIYLVNNIFKTEYQIKRPYNLKDLLIILLIILVLIIILIFKYNN